MTNIPAYIPRIGTLLQGFDYDMAVRESATHANELTRHPIEDPERSFIYDHNREEPAMLDISIVVSTVPLTGGQTIGSENEGVLRMMRLQDKILSERAAQSVSTSGYLDVYTGLRRYLNMAIEQVTFDRDEATPNTMTIELSLVEMRFARPPRTSDKEYLMDANDGPRNVANASLVEAGDRPIVEGVSRRQAPRIATLPESLEGTVATELKKNPSRLEGILDGVPRGRLDGLLDGVVDPATVVPNFDPNDELGVLLLEDTPAQSFTTLLDSVEHEMLFQYNQTADRWSFASSVVGERCPIDAGIFIEAGIDFYADLPGAQHLLMIDRPGISVSGSAWYERIITPLGDGLPATMLVTGSTSAFASLFYNVNPGAC